MSGYRLTKAASEDLLAVYLHGLDTFGQAQADAYHALFEHTFTLLAAQPGIARLRTEITPPVRIHPVQAHLVVYEIEEAGDILILRLRHGREDWRSDPL